jgi:hypothetical protein
METTATPGIGYRGKLADPQVRIDRARKAGRARTTVAYHVAAIARHRGELTHALTADLAAIVAQALTGGGDGT